MTDKEIHDLKREAKRMKKATDWTHAQALDVVARRHGFQNWALLMKAHNKEKGHE